MQRLKGLKNLLHDAVEETTNLIERTHRSVAEKQLRRAGAIEPIAGPARAVDEVHRMGSETVYATIRAVNRGIDAVTDAPFSIAQQDDDSVEQRTAPVMRTPLRSDALGTPAWWIDSAQGALNGLIGDYLRGRGNGLDVGMTLRQDGISYEPTREGLARALAGATGKVVVFLHGLSCTEWAWSFLAHELHGDPKVTFGSLLRRELGYTPLYVRYNTGLHVSDNGQELSELLQRVVDAYPTAVEEVVLVGHSMGGLVVRSAAHYGHERSAPWAHKLRNVFCIGAPNLGAPMEKGTNLLAAVLRAFDTPGTQVPAQILNARSSGIKDLRFGYISEEEWKDVDPDALLEDNRRDIPFVPHAGYFFVASSVTRDPKHPVGQLVGDLLVRLPSAAGVHREVARRVPFHMGRVFGGMTHFHLANHPDVYEQIRFWCAETQPLPAGG